MRPTTADHVIFDESIEVFRPESEEFTRVNESNKGTIFGYLMLDFNLENSLEFENFTIFPTQRVSLPGEYCAYIAPVMLPQWIDSGLNTSRFTMALSAIISFVTSRPVKSPRRNYYSNEVIPEQILTELAIQFPVLIAGVGSHRPISKDSLEKIREDINDIISILFGLSYKNYKKAMQTIRLVQLAHNNTREDFALAYFLLVSAIESVAQLATKVKKYRIKHELECKWEDMAKSNEDLLILLKVYREARGKNNYLKERCVDFILEYCPPQEWETIEHPLAYYADIIGEFESQHLTEKSWYEKYPSDLSDDYIVEILSDMYTHRSKFTHRGENPPHQEAVSYNKFFQEIRDNNSDTNNDGRINYKTTLLPNINLVSFIARKSIVKYFEKKVLGKNER